MRTKEEQKWKDLIGKLLHIKIESVYPCTGYSIKVTGMIIENEEYFEFEVDLEEDLPDE